MKKLFLIVANLCISAHSYVFAQTFVPEEPAIAMQSSSRYHWIDLDGDGDTDVLEFGGYNGVIIHTRNGSSFTASQSGLPDNFLRLEIDFRLNDYDNDGDLDILFSRFNDLAIGVNTGNNSFTAIATSITFNDNGYGAIYWQDIDGDLDLDVVHNRSIYINNNGVYTKSTYALAPEIQRVIWGDINNDGLIDILATVGYDQYSGNPIQVFTNKGDGNFQSSGIDFELKVRDPGALLLFDANNDGKLDILAMDEIWGRCFILRNTMAGGQIQFAAGYSLGAGISGNVAQAGDINSDGLADIVMSGYSYLDNKYQLMVFKNASSANLSFSKTNSFESAVYVNALHLIDYDEDNDLDIHMKVYNPDLYLETNNVLINTGTAAVPAPSIPLNQTTAVGKNINLAWTGQPQYSYNIEFKRNGQVFRVNPTTASGKLQLTDNPSLISSPVFTVYSPPAGSYEWRVQAVDKQRRTSAYSAAGTFEIASAPTGLTLEILEMTSVKLCWNSTVNATSFAIFRRLNNSAVEEIANVAATTLCYTDASLQKNGYYEYFVKAVTSGVYSAPTQTVAHYSYPFVPVPFGNHEPNIVTASCHPADYDLDGDYDLEFMGRILSNYGSDLNFRNDGTGNFPQKISILPTLDLESNRVIAAQDMDNDGDTDFCVILGSEYSWQKLAVLINENGALTLGFQTDQYLSMYQASVTDFNNDGRPDILFRHAVGNSNGNPQVYELLLQANDGTFADSKFKFTDAEYGELGQFCVGDINNDGFQDICFTGTQYEPLRFFINEGGMTFATHSPDLPTTPISFLDVDGDGITDFVGSATGGYRWYKGSGNFQYTRQQQIHESYSIDRPSVKMADFNLDGLPDFIITDGYRSSVAFNKGNAVFEMGTIELEGNWDSSFAITDMENDGDLDIVKLGSDDYHQGYNYFYLNQARKFGLQNSRPTVPPSLAATFSFGNLNIGWQPSTDDKTPAGLLSYNLWIKDSGGKTWLHGETDATGLFRTRLTSGNAGYRTSYTLRDLPPGTYKLRVQSIDAAFASSPWSPELSVTIAPGPTNLQVERILLNKVKLTWTGSAFVEQHVIVERKTVESEYEVVAELPAGAVVFTDENLIYNKHYEYRVTEVSNGTTTSSSNVATWSTLMWIVKETSLPNLTGGSIDVGDYTGDGKMDLLLNGAKVHNDHYAENIRAAVENTDAGWVRNDITSSILSTTATFRFFDVNADHKLDLYQHGYIWIEGPQTEVYLNNGDKTFTPTSNEFTQHKYDVLARYDVDMDNDLDIAVVDQGNGGGKKLLRNDGSSYTAEDLDAGCGFGCPGVVVSADFDGDGDEDFIRSENHTFTLYLYKPEGWKNSGITFSAYENQVGVLDYNGDGLPDIALLTSSSYGSGKLYVNRGLKDGTLQFEVIRSDLPSGQSSFSVADFDHDGYQDIALLSPSGTMYRNTGQGTFDEYKIPFYTFGSVRPGIIDFDNDGDLDLYITGYNNYQLYSTDQPFSRVILNQTIDAGKGVQNNPPAPPVNLSTVQDSLGMHFTWSSGVDDHTPATGLTYDIILYRDGKAILKASIDPTTGKRQTIERGRFTDHAIINNLRTGAYTWKVQAVDQSFAGSELSVTGSFTFIPLPPMVRDTVIYRCGRNVTITATGTDIRWYSDRTMTNLIATGELHPTQSQIVYATQKVDGYEGVPRRVAITILETAPQPLTTPLLSFCENYTGPVYLSATGEEIRWYGDINKNQLLATTPYVSVALSEKTYYVTQTLTGCESAVVPVSISKTVINSDIFSTNDKLEVKEQSADYYAWYKNGSYIFNSNSPSIPYLGETATYAVLITKDGCTESSNVYSMPNDLVTAVEGSNDEDWSVYPNPAPGYFTIEAPASRGVVKIYDATGRIVYSATVDNSEAMSESKQIRIPGGVYMVTLEEGTQVSSKRLVVY